MGIQKIQLISPDQLYLTESGMIIGFGASGKGFAADHLKKRLLEKGVSDGVINAKWGLDNLGYAPKR
ncbi:MAG: FAD:protein FMN transferase [Owenweeksia sp.]|nr:FAD:protein FMN transferase [Owenweeksia sp.]